MQEINDNYDLGIIGGMGPLATSFFYDQIIKHTEANKDNGHINIIILNHASMISRVEAVNDTNKKEIFLSQIKKDFDILNNLKVKNIAIPCNGSHAFFEEFINYTDINILNMPKETILNIIENNPKIKRVGLLATDATINSKIYAKEIDKNNLEIILPNEETQKLVMSLIYEDIKNTGKLDAEKILFCIKQLQEKGAEKIILGCTELSLFKDFDIVKDVCVDALSILVKKSIEITGKNYKD